MQNSASTIFCVVERDSKREFIEKGKPKLDLLRNILCENTESSKNLQVINQVKLKIGRI